MGAEEHYTIIPRKAPHEGRRDIKVNLLRTAFRQGWLLGALF